MVLGVVAYVIYPKDAPVVPADAVQGVAVSANFTPNAMNVNEIPDPAVNGLTLQIVLHAASRLPHSGSVDVVLPHGRGPMCPARGSPPAALWTRPDSGTSRTSFRTIGRTTESTNPAADRYELRLSITVSDVGSNLSRNNEFVSVLIPPISFQQTGSPGYTKVFTVYAEQVPGGNAYTWSTGANPVYLDGFDRWSVASAGSIADTVSPTLNSGTDLAVQARNGNLQFIAGIVVGVAGGALVGAVQEWLDARRKPKWASRSRRPSAAPDPSRTGAPPTRDPGPGEEQCSDGDEPAGGGEERPGIESRRRQRGGRADGDDGRLNARCALQLPPASSLLVPSGQVVPPQWTPDSGHPSTRRHRGSAPVSVAPTRLALLKLARVRTAWDRLTPASGAPTSCTPTHCV